MRRVAHISYIRVTETLGFGNLILCFPTCLVSRKHLTVESQPGVFEVGLCTVQTSIARRLSRTRHDGVGPLVFEDSKPIQMPVWPFSSQAQLLAATCRDSH